MLQMNVTIVAGCECEKHAWVHLRDGTGERRARVMIDAAVGRAIVSELRRSPSPHAEAVDLLGTSLTALGAQAERIELRCTDGALSGEGLIAPTKIASMGGSYGGGMSMALGALKNRQMMPDGSLVPWVSAGGKALAIAAAQPDIPWTDLAYALTTHKSQGSEWPWVVVVCHGAHRFMLDRALLYTAITRGKQGVVLVGDDAGLESALAKVDSAKRNTTLKERLQARGRAA